MAFFQTKNTNLGKLWTPLQWKLLVYLDYFTAILYILSPLGIFLWLFGRHFPRLVFSKKNLATLHWMFFPIFFGSPPARAHACAAVFFSYKL
jgi:hypothetical protein